MQQLYERTMFARRYYLQEIFPKLNIDKLKRIGYSGASFANNFELYSQLGFISLLSHNNKNIISLIFRSYKSKRLCSSAISAEVVSFSDLLYSAFKLLCEFKLLLNNTSIPLELFTVSKSLFYIISKGSRDSEKRSMLYVAAARNKLTNK